jgi:hypothetical protein
MAGKARNIVPSMDSHIFEGPAIKFIPARFGASPHYDIFCPFSGLQVDKLEGSDSWRVFPVKTGWVYDKRHAPIDIGGPVKRSYIEADICGFYPQDVESISKYQPMWSVFVNYSPRDSIDWVAFHLDSKCQYSYMLNGSIPITAWTRRETLIALYGIADRLLSSCRGDNRCLQTDFALIHRISWMFYQELDWIDRSYHFDGDVHYPESVWVERYSSMVRCEMLDETIHPLRYYTFGFRTESMNLVCKKFGFGGLQDSHSGVYRVSMHIALCVENSMVGNTILRGSRSRKENSSWPVPVELSDLTEAIETIVTPLVTSRDNTTPVSKERESAPENE